MLKRFLLIGFSLLFSSLVMATPMWHCNATTTAQINAAVWNLYGESHNSTRDLVEKQCKPFNKGKACEIICFPPQTYWRCMAHDTIPVVQQYEFQRKVVTPKQGTWYWTSSTKTIAINGARDACRHNSRYGGCFVDPDACSSS